jgi:hypothetical protein
MFDKVLHQTRHPFDVFATCQRIMKLRKNRQWMKRLFLDFIKREDIEKFYPYGLLAVWVKWNDIVEKQCNPLFQYRIEDIKEGNDTIHRIFEAFDLEKPERICLLPNKEKSRPNRIYLEDLPEELAIAVEEKANKYGYVLE